MGHSRAVRGGKDASRRAPSQPAEAEADVPTNTPGRRFQKAARPLLLAPTPALALCASRGCAERRARRAWWCHHLRGTLPTQLRPAPLRQVWRTMHLLRRTRHGVATVGDILQASVEDEMSWAVAKLQAHRELAGLRREDPQARVFRPRPGRGLPPPEGTAQHPLAARRRCWSRSPCLRHAARWAPWRRSPRR